MTHIPRPMYASTYDESYPGAGSGAALAKLGDQPPTLSAKVIEGLFYLNMVNGTFMTITGWGASFRFIGGGPTAITGLLALAILLVRRERIPLVVWFAGIMCISAHISQLIVAGAMPIVGEGVGPMTLWFFNLIIMSVIIQNDGARKRVAIFFAVLIFVSLQLGAVDLATAARGGRLTLVKVVSGAFQDANSLSYLAGLFGVCFLFWSLRCSNVIRPVFWLLAAFLALVVLRTVSRGGILTFCCGLSVLAAAVLLGRGVRLSGLVLIMVAVIAGLFIVSVASDSLDYLDRRLGEESIRSKVYSWHLLGDLARTIVLGQGTRAHVTGAGINAHNAFIYTHMALGGITAYPYLIMLLWLGSRVTRFVFARDLPLDLRMWVLALFGMSLASQLMTNVGYQEAQCVFAMAVVDRFTWFHIRRGSDAPQAQRQMAPSWVYARGAMPLANH